MTVDVERMTFGQLLDEAARRYGDAEALVFKGERITYRGLKERVDALAAGLIELGVEPGDRVALWLHNRPEWVYAFFAVAKVGAVLVPMNTRLRTAEAEYVLRQSESSTVLLADEFRGTSYLGMLQELCPELPSSAPGRLHAQRLPDLRRVVVLGGTRHPGTFGFDEVVGLGERTGPGRLREREAAVRHEDPCLIMYTSGTTGFPKGAVHSHKVIRNMADAAHRLGIDQGDRLVLYLPFFHVFGSFAGLTLFTYVGGCLVLMELFDPREALALMERERATVVYGFDTHFHDLMRVPDFQQYDLSSIRKGLAPCPPDAAAKIQATFGRISNGYGMTETTSLTACLSPDEPREKFIHTAGRPLPGFECKVIDPATGAALPPGRAGELCVRGHPVMLGYYKKPEETAKAIDADGWFHTGDMAVFDEDGYLKIVGRIKEMFKVGGENVDPVEVEALLQQHPAVGMAKVVGVPDERLGEVGAAFVQLKPGQAATEQELIDWCRGKLASFKVPRYVRFLEEYPMTPSGKVQKFKLREMAVQELGLKR